MPLVVQSALAINNNDDDDDDDDDGANTVVILGPPPPAPPAVMSRDELGRVTLRATRLVEPLIVDGKLDYNGDRYGLKLEHLHVGESFKPELGFLRREAFRRYFGQARFSPRPRSIEAIRRFTFQGEVDYIEGLPTGRIETRRYQGQFRIEFSGGDQATVQYNTTAPSP